MHVCDTLRQNLNYWSRLPSFFGAVAVEAPALASVAVRSVVAFVFAAVGSVVAFVSAAVRFVAVSASVAVEEAAVGTVSAAAEAAAASAVAELELEAEFDCRQHDSIAVAAEPVSGRLLHLHRCHPTAIDAPVKVAAA